MTNTTTKPLAQDPQRAWQTVLGQLQMEMPRASFDTWVRDTQALSYEDGRLTIGTRNAYACEWLENRLSSTVSRLLIGVMNQQTKVEFVVERMADDADADDDAEEKDSGKNEVMQANATRYEEAVKPHRVIVIPGYALRLLAQGDQTAKEMSLWTAFRQAVYFDWKKTDTPPMVTKNIPHQAITRFANMSRASYYRAINGIDELAGGMVVRLPEAPQTGADPHLDNAIRWRVAMSPHLTHHDAAVIEMILTADIAFAGEDVVERMDAALRSLKDMTQRHPAEYLDEISPPAQKPAASNVLTILRRVLGLEGDIPAALFEAAEALQNRLMSAFGSVVIPHHFLTTSAPYFGLTQSQMWTVIVLRDRVFYDYEQGVEYDFVMAKQGLESISRWTGVSVKSLKRWFDQPEFQQFVHLSPVQIPEEKQDEGAERLRSFIARGGEVVTVHKNEPPLGYLQHGEEQIPVWTKRSLALDKVSNGSGQSEHRVWTKRAMGLDKVSNGSGQSEHPLNNLFKPLLNPFKPHNPLPTTSPKEKTSAGSSPSALPVVGVGWEMTDLLALNPVSDQKLRERLLDKGDPVAFVSWLLYAHSLEGEGIKSPSNLAISNIGRKPTQGARQTYMEIARLGPDHLRKRIDKLAQTNHYGFAQLDDDFSRIFKKVSKDKLHDLASCLFVECSLPITS